jgi:hypothetical protein
MMGLLPHFGEYSRFDLLTYPHFRAALIRLSYFVLMSSRNMGGVENGDFAENLTPTARLKLT